MKELNLEEMSSIEGGWIDTCAGFAVGTAVENGLSPGSVEWAIITQLAYDACWQQYF